ncbi:hypothetical protein ACVI1J_007141 [Bradyrhizobium diazoefficiens]
MAPPVAAVFRPGNHDRLDRTGAPIMGSLRIATNGYNVSFEKPVVVVHDRAVPFGRLLD